MTGFLVILVFVAVGAYLGHTRENIAVLVSKTPIFGARILVIKPKTELFFWGGGGGEFRAP
jgi:hypothetical protein